MKDTAVGRVAAMWRFPVKSMRGERVEEIRVTAEGLHADRAFALVDVETGQLVSAKNIRRFPGLFEFRACLLDAPVGHSQAPKVMIECPDGQETMSDAEGVDALLSSHLGREVRLVRIGGDTGVGTERGGPFHDAAPASLLTNSTLARMSELQPGSLFDARRFRMNFILDCDEAGFPENRWVGRTLQVGDEIRLQVTKPDARCVMTTLAQDELPEDRSILTGLAKHNRLKVGEKGPYPCAGVYARVLRGGVAAEGDAVQLCQA
jgi:uncharacterized protein YcbX